MKRFITSTAVLILGAMFPVVTGANAQSSLVPNSRVPISECISKDKKLDVLFIVDQSISLLRNKDRTPGTDPLNERVTALKAVLNVLNTKAAKEDDQLRVDVTVAHAGFGEKFVLHQDWTKLDSSGFSSLMARIDNQAFLNDEIFTRYHLALDGTVKTFEKRSSEDSTCRMAIWFSDGKHDDDNEGGGFSSAEQKQIRETICGPGGLADRLRSNGIFTIAVGLNSNENDLELMKLVAENSGSLSSPNLSNCGELPAYGKFEIEKNPDQLVETLFNLVNTTPGGRPLSPTKSKSCADGTLNCSEISFEVTDEVNEFTMLIDRKDPNVEVELRTGAGQKHSLFGSAQINDANAKASTLSDNRLFLDVQRKKNGTINGTWTVRFLGNRNEEASALVKFVGESVVNAEAQTESGGWDQLTVLDRFNTYPVRVSARTNTTGVVIEDIKVLLRPSASVGETSEVLLPLVSTGDGQFTISENDLQSALKQKELSRATNAEIVVRINAAIPGLIDASTGEDVQVEFKDEVFSFAVSNGSEWPLYLGQVDNPKIKGTDKQSIQFRFKGADGRDTRVSFTDELDIDIGLQFISGQECDIPKDEETVCTLELKPSKESYGSKTLLANALFTTLDDASQSSEVEIRVTADFETATDPCRGIKYAVSLLLFFLFVQAVQRFLFAVLMSRFAKLNQLDRRARLDIEISESGNVSGRGGSLIAIDRGDESFVFENSEPKSTFYLFGYQFDTSAVRTFMRSTSTPQGLVTHEGKYVFGSAGTHLDKKKSGTSQGVVSLSLRGQWIIAIDHDDMLRLVDGADLINAELVVYLDPPARTSFDQQLSDLSFEIASGRLAQDLSQVITHLRESATDEPFVKGPTFEGDDIFGSPNETSGLNDPFATMEKNNSSNESVDDDSKRPRFGRKKKAKNEENEIGDEGGFSSPDLNDPFA
jgi:hypothetical protein